MAREIKCPQCGNTFHLHGRGTGPRYSAVKCYECNNLFNPRKQSDET